MLTDNSIEPKEEVQEDEVEFEIESPPLPPAFPSLIPEFKPIVPKDDYDFDPGALDDDFVEESRVKEEEEDGLDGENQKVEVFTVVKHFSQVLPILQWSAALSFSHFESGQRRYVRIALQERAVLGLAHYQQY